MTEFMEGVLTGVLGTLAIGTIVALVAVMKEFKRDYGDTSLRVDDWNRKKAAQYGARTKDFTGN